jgi:hypothetical protein
MHDDEKREGRDELNLAEWPIAVVGRRSRDLTVTYEDTIRLPNGAFLHRRWVVSGTPEYGLPGPLAQDVYLALMELSKENHFASPRVEFSLRDLCRRLGRASGGQSIKQVKEALECFTYTTIHAENAFWDNKRKVYESKTFHILVDFILVC